MISYPGINLNIFSFAGLRGNVVNVDDNPWLSIITQSLPMQMCNDTGLSNLFMPLITLLSHITKLGNFSKGCLQEN